VNRRNLETYDLHARMDRLISIAMCVACVLVLLFTGAGEVLLGQLAAYVATWGAL
jgi:hypothetical protein